MEVSVIEIDTYAICFAFIGLAVAVIWHRSVSTRLHIGFFNIVLRSRIFNIRQRAFLFPSIKIGIRTIAMELVALFFMLFSIVSLVDASGDILPDFSKEEFFSNIKFLENGFVFVGVSILLLLFSVLLSILVPMTSDRSYDDLVLSKRSTVADASGDHRAADVSAPVEEQKEMLEDKNDESWKVKPLAIEKLNIALEEKGEEFFNTSKIRKKIALAWGDDPEEKTDFQYDFWKSKVPK